jgi:hypothetical protein
MVRTIPVYTFLADSSLEAAELIARKLMRRDCQRLEADQDTYPQARGISTITTPSLPVI